MKEIKEAVTHKYLYYFDTNNINRRKRSKVYNIYVQSKKTKKMANNKKKGMKERKELILLKKI